MLTSLKVVRIAAVDCDCTRRSATRWRRRDIGTRCSARGPVGIWAARGADGLACGVGCAWAWVLEEAATTSPLVTRPSRPLPATFDVSTPCSAAILRAAGEAAPAAAEGAGATGAAGAEAPEAPVFAGVDWACACAGGAARLS